MVKLIDSEDPEARKSIHDLYGRYTAIVGDIVNLKSAILNVSAVQVGQEEKLEAMEIKANAMDQRLERLEKQAD